ncbi:hypothetical protein N9H69_04295 [Flavobacteriaceae bacterium]|nr:hypothetical protein [Flavobacteriaceae bacterium]
MKFKIVFYLFLFVCIILFFQLINTNKILNHQDRLIQNQNSLQLRLKDSLSNLKKTLSVQQYFTFEGDTETSEALKIALLSFNNDRDLKNLIQDLPQGERFLIDNIQLVNEDWVLIGFRSTKNKGQAFLTYKKTSKGFEFNPLKSVVNPL